MNQTSADHKKLAGITLMVGAVLVVFTMAHHPSGGHGMGALGVIVHGVMILLMLQLFIGFVAFCGYQDLQRPAILAGLVCYGASTIAHVGAATINGFVVVALAARGDTISHEIFVLCWEVNQALARLGVATTGLAFVFWSTAFFAKPSGPNKLLGVFAIVAGVAPLVWLVGVSTELNVMVALAVYASHALWTFGVGYQLMRRAV